MCAATDRIFDAKIARNVGLVRRSKRFLDRIGCRIHFIEAAEQRGWPVYEVEDHLLVICKENPTITRIA